MLRRKGCAAPIAVLPQFGVDPEIFAPEPSAAVAAPASSAPFRIGYAGGLLPEKGVDLLLRACAGLRGDWRLHLAGGGTSKARCNVYSANVASRVTWTGRLPSAQMPGFYRRSTHWPPQPHHARLKEQFGPC